MQWPHLVRVRLELRVGVQGSGLGLGFRVRVRVQGSGLGFGLGLAPVGAPLPAAVERRGGGAAVAARPRLKADGGVVLDDAHGGAAEQLLQVIRISQFVRE